MIRAAILFALAALVAGCDEGKRGVPRFTQPGPVPQPQPQPAPTPAPAPAPVPRPITFGEDTKDTFKGTPLAYTLIAPAAGTLVVQISWDVWYNGSLLVLAIDGKEFKPVGPAWAPVVGKVAVAAGQTCTLVISPGGTDWFYDDAFVLTTSIE
jgi:hypothetical protein